MRNIRFVVSERYNAWLGAHDLWQKHLEGLDINDPEVRKQLELEDQKKKLKQVLEKKGDRLPTAVKRHLAMKLLGDEKLAEEALEQWKKEQTQSIESRMAAFKIQGDGYDLDMTPKSDRPYRSLRRVGGFSVTRGRKIKIPLPRLKAESK
jgi:hypothetical protein